MLTSGNIWIWLDQHSGAVTALSTVALAVLTGWYSTLNVFLLRQQRRLASEAKLAHTLVSEQGELRLEVRNLGSGPATNVSLQAGPARPVPDGLDVENLGRAIDLGPSESFRWPIHVNQQPTENLRVTLMARDSTSKSLWFSTFEIRVANGGADTSAGWEGKYSARQMKRKIFYNIPMKDIPGFFRRHWRDPIDELIVEKRARQILSSALADSLEKNLGRGKRYEEVMVEI
jgi:hypothetical protein